MKQKGWIERTEEGRLAITADGVEQVEANVKGHRFELLENHSQPARAEAGARR
jgi:hypothetical protein